MKSQFNWLLFRDDIIVCLSEIVREAILTDKEHTVDEACRKELRVEVLRRVNSINT